MVVHEAGHVQGLAHPLTDSYNHDATAPTMAGGDNAFFDNTLEGRSLETDDIAGAEFIQFQVPGYYSDLQTALNAAQLYNATVHLTENYTTSSDITVASNAELAIYPGVNFNFSSGNGLIVNGELDAIGTGDPVQFASTGSSWTGIELYGSGSSLLHAKIQEAENGIAAYNTSGISLQYVEVSNNSQDGVRLVNTTIETGFPHNIHAENNGRYGIYVDGQHNSGLRNNTLKNNTYAQLKADGGATLDNMSNTEITGGSSQGLFAQSGSEMEISGSNIYNNSYYDAYAISNSTIDAQSNYWGTPYPSSSQFYSDGTSSIDYSNPLFTDPLPSSITKQPEDSIAITSGKVNLGNPEEINTVSELRSMLRNEYGTNFAGQLSALDNLHVELKEPARSWVDVIRMELLQITGKHKQAVSLGSEVLNDATRSQSIRRTAARRMFYGYLLGLKEPDKATGMITRLKQMEGREAMDGQLSRLLELHNQRLGQQNSGELLTDASGSNSPRLITNYPNPFNPTTTLEFKLPAESNVTLRIYDITGRKVATLVNERLESGEHQVSFDASNLASGVYLYRLKADNFVQTRKLTVIK